MEKQLSFGKVIVTEVKQSAFNNRLEAVLKQTATENKTFYKDQGNNLDATLFDKEVSAFFDNDSTRVYFLKNLPEGIDTIEKVQEYIDTKFKKLHLYRILSFSPILTKGDIEMIEKDKITLDTKAMSQLVKDKDGNPAKYKDHYQYRRICLWTEFKEDKDERDITKIYVPESLRVEEEASVTAEA